jgi:XRE family transcriptional regulator, regulator of sulfur utilization
MGPDMKRGTEDETQTQIEQEAGTIDTAVAVAPEPSRPRRGAEVRRKYDFAVIRTLRHQKGLTIEKFAKLCGLSYAPISRIETNLIKPNLDTLDKIAEGLGITTHSLIALAEKKETESQTAAERRSGGFVFRAVTYEGVEVLYGTARKGATTLDSEIRGQSVSWVVVKSGLLQVKVNDKLYKLGPGESLHFESSFSHRLTALEDVDVTLVVHPRR